MKIIVALLALLAMPAFAEINGSVGATSQYVFRGVSQGENPAIQVSLSANKGPLYGTFWASQVDFGEPHTEANYLVGLQNDHFDLGYLQYDYYGDDVKIADEVKEIYAGVKVGPFAAYVFHDPDAKTEYYNFSAGHEFEHVNVKAFAGFSEDYDHTGVTVGKKFGPVSVNYTFDYLEGAKEHSVGLFYNF